MREKNEQLKNANMKLMLSDAKNLKNFNNNNNNNKIGSLNRCARDLEVAIMVN